VKLSVFFSVIAMTVAIGNISASTQDRERAAIDGNERIVGGEEVAVGDGPWAVRLNITRSDGNQYICGASLVAPRVSSNPLDTSVTWQGGVDGARWLITAAHCIWDNGAGTYVLPSAVKAITGRIDLNATGGEERSIIAMIPHSDYATNPDHDIALLIMNESSTSLPEARRRSIRLPALFDVGWLENPYLALITQGWGKTDESGATSQNLLEVRVPQVDRTTCENRYAPYGYSIPSGQICAGFVSGGFDSCGGDSGGPLLYRPATDSTALMSGNLSRDEVLVGVVSWGVGCARQDLFGVYTSVSRYSEWLRSSVIRCLRDTATLNDCS